MGIHVVGELVAKVDFSPWGEGSFRVRAVPEESTNDLGVPLVVETKQGELKLWIHEEWIDVPLGEEVALRLKVAGEEKEIELYLTMPYREWLGEKEVIRLNDDPLRKIAAVKPDQQEFIEKLKQAAMSLATVLVDAEEIFESGPLGPKGFRYSEKSDE